VQAVQLSPVLDRIGAYPFARLDAARAAAEARGVEVLDFGMGDPSEPPEPEIAQALVDALPLTGGYPRAQGLPELRDAVARWVGRRFDAALDPDREVIPTLGSKEAIFSLAQVLLDREAGRTVVAYTEPGYPVYERGALFAGGEPLPVPLLEENGFLPDLDAVDWDGVCLLWVNYPNNPTGAAASLAFYEHAAELAREHGFVLASDEAYTELWFDAPPPSALQLADRTNVLVLNTLSKRSSMTGYRSGFAAGDPALVGALKAFRPSIGTAPQEFVQRASVVAWDDEAHVERARARYAAKRAAFDGVLPLVGSEATMYLWARVPTGESSEELATRLLEHGVLVSPGAYFGPSGEGYFRIALVPSLDDCGRAAEILRRVL
jgi:N-succinyldiaminopimelate aminotransferase